MHDAITVGVPVVAILFGILLNQSGLIKLGERMDKLDARMDKMQSELTGRIDRISADLAQFYSILGAHGEAIDNLKDRTKNL